MKRFCVFALAAAALLTGSLQAEMIFGVTDAGNLVTFNSTAPALFLSQTGISGLQTGERILGIDFRPNTGQLFAVGSSNRLYTINTTTGAASQLGPAFSVPLNGANFGVNFNPVADRIRVVSDARQNLRLNPNDGSVVNNAADASLTYADATLGLPNIFGTSYENSVPGALTTRQFFLDPVRDLLGVINFPNANFNAGVINSVGSLGVNIASNAPLGFDISAASGIAYLASGNNLWTVNTATGAATLVGSVGVGSGQNITSISAAPVPEPGSWSLLLGAAAVLFGAHRRRRSS